ncbi:MAG TPA: PP2C family protein-serine/threonine phosphatase [Terracidiphilus sp.]|nr:PP2C family protein-serine/threonine phosphatase [Terracidiphilus sp.]
MLRLPRRLFVVLGLLLVCLAFLPARAATPDSAPVLSIDGLGKGAAPIGGAWQFHLGDDAAWARADIDDTAGHNGWEQLTVNQTWGMQGHPAYTGFAWYRKRLHIVTAPGSDPDLAMMLGQVDDIYELYWNGKLVGHYGKMPPNADYLFQPAPQTFGLGPVRDGVLAVRVWQEPLLSFQGDNLGGFHVAPIIGSPQAIAALRAQSDYEWLRRRQYYFGLHALNGLVMLLSLLAWLRARRQKVLLALAAYNASGVAALLLVGMHLPLSFYFSLGWLQPVLSVADVALWFLLFYLLKLDDNRRLARATYLLAALSLTATSCDGLLSAVDWTNPLFAPWVAAADGALTAIFTIAQIYPLVLVAFALRKRLDSTRWLLAGAACLDEMLSVMRIALQQGSRYTHWTLGNRIALPIFTIYGNTFNAQTLADTLLLIAVIYAVYRYIQEAARRQSSMEQEYKSARELQQVLIPETLPSLPGYAFTSAYRPAQEVGGDFFQVLPLEGAFAGSTLVLLGDVSGKGLRAAMTVSLIVGAVRTVVRYEQSPAKILAELNARLFGRMQGGFATCLALRLGPDGECVMASAGHPAPYLNKNEVDLPGALPLGVVAMSSYQEETLDLKEGDHFALYTDGLLEARGADGEIFSFERLDALFSTSPDAAKASDAAIDFGQEDDITVLTLTRLSVGQVGRTALSAPVLTPA